jgi:primosomal protein N'
VIARVTLDLALGKEFDYLIPDELEDVVEVGTRVKVPFARRQVLGCVTALLEIRRIPICARSSKPSDANRTSPPNPGLGAVDGRILLLPAGDCALKTVLPEAVRQEKEGWREQLFVRALPAPETAAEIEPAPGGNPGNGPRGQRMPLQELLRQTGTTAQTLRRLEDKGLIRVAPQISERDPYARDTSCPPNRWP